MNVNKAFGKVLNCYLEDQNYTKVQFSKRTNISRKNLYRILNGDVSPTLDTIELISIELGVSPGTLVSKANQIKLKNKAVS